MKTSHIEEVTKLKRQLVSRTPYDALQAKKMISRLTVDLSQAKAELQVFTNQKEKNKSNP